MNPDVCAFCSKHRYTFVDDLDDRPRHLCEPSPTGYHRVARIETWRDRPLDRWDNLYDWATEVFERDGTVEHVPVEMRRALTRLWSSYPNMPRGTSDPMYMANVLAFEMGFGDGLGNFHEINVKEATS